MRARGLAALATAAVITLVLPVKAQTTIDVAKITCDQWLAYKVADPNSIALWLSGYYNARRDNTVVKVEAFKEDIEKLKDYCIRNPNTLVMKAVETRIVQGAR